MYLSIYLPPSLSLSLHLSSFTLSLSLSLYRSKCPALTNTLIYLSLSRALLFDPLDWITRAIVVTDAYPLHIVPRVSVTISAAPGLFCYIVSSLCAPVTKHTLLFTSYLSDKQRSRCSQLLSDEVCACACVRVFTPTRI